MHSHNEVITYYTPKCMHIHTSMQAITHMYVCMYVHGFQYHMEVLNANKTPTYIRTIRIDLDTTYQSYRRRNCVGREIGAKHKIDSK